MIFDLELSDEDVERLEKGGFFVIYLEDGIKITITKEEIDRESSSKGELL